MKLDPQKTIEALLLIGQLVAKHGPAVAAWWQGLFEAGRLPTPADYAALEALCDKDARRDYFGKETQRAREAPLSP